MSGRRVGILVVMAVVASSTGCGFKFFDGWQAARAVVRAVPMAPDDAWQELQHGLSDMELVVAGIRPEDRVIEFDWLTTPGDGGEYLRCEGRTVVGRHRCGRVSPCVRHLKAAR